MTCSVFINHGVKTCQIRSAAAAAATAAAAGPEEGPSAVEPS